MHEFYKLIVPYIQKRSLSKVISVLDVCKSCNVTIPDDHVQRIIDAIVFVPQGNIICKYLLNNFDLSNVQRQELQQSIDYDALSSIWIERIDFENSPSSLDISALEKKMNTINDILSDLE